MPSTYPIFTSVYHLINEDMLKQCHKELDGSKAVGIDKVTKDEYGKNLDRNIKDLVQRLKNKSFKPLPSLRVYIPKANGKKRPLGIASYEDKIVQMAVKKILGAIYEPRFLNCMYGFRPNRGCHEAIKEVYQRISYGKISYIVDADIKGLTILETTTSLLGFIPSRRTSSVQLVIEKRLLLPSSVFTYVPFP